MRVRRPFVVAEARAALAAAIARFISGGGSPGSPPLDVFCAWCRRRRVADDEWVAAAEVDVASHGICPTCEEKLLADLRSL